MASWGRSASASCVGARHACARACPRIRRSRTRPCGFWARERRAYRVGHDLDPMNLGRADRYGKRHVFKRGNLHREPHDGKEPYDDADAQLESRRRGETARRRCRDSPAQAHHAKAKDDDESDQGRVSAGGCGGVAGVVVARVSCRPHHESNEHTKMDERMTMGRNG